MDGWITIGTKIAKDGFKQGAKDLKKDMKDLDNDLSKDLDNVDKKTAKIGNNLSKSTKNVGKELLLMGVALAGLAVGGFILSKALDKAFGSSDQLKANLSYIGFVASKLIENLLAPAIDKTTGSVEGLVGALYKAVVYIGWIIQAFTKRDLFAGTSVEDYQKSMEKANKSTKGTANSVKQIKKDLMGFDEINKLSDDSSSGSSGSSVVLPNLPKIEDIEKPGWIKWIEDNTDTIKKIAEWVGLTILALKGAEWINNLTSASGLLGGINTNSLLIAGSIGVIIWSVGEWLKTLHEIKKENDIIRAQGEAQHKEWVETEEDVDRLQKDIMYRRRQLNENLDQAKNTWKQMLGVSGQYVINVKEMVRFNQDNLDKQLEMYKTGKMTAEQKEKYIERLRTEYATVKDTTQELVLMGVEAKDLNDTANHYKEILDDIGWGYEDINSFIQDQIKRTFGEQNEQAKTWLQTVNWVKDAMKNVADTKFSKKELQIDVKADTSNFKNTMNNIFSKLGAKGFDFFGNIKLASGGIINNPGKGVPLGTSIVGGEAGPEAVIPLNDKTLNALGEAIARNMTINLTNVNQMNGRTISRELQRISNENDFSFNG